MLPQKPPELVEPDIRMQNMVVSREDLAVIAAGWPATEAVTNDEVARMLTTCRDLFEHCYFVYEFGLVAVIWSVLAVEAALRDCLGEQATDGDGLARLIGKAQGRGWLTTDQGERLRAGAEFRNRIAHAQSHGVLTLPLVAGALDIAHEAIVRIYARAGDMPPTTSEAECPLFIGVDAAWGASNETGLVALEPSGRVRDAGWTIGVDATARWIVAHAEPNTLVFIDAPLVVRNVSGQRLCEKQVGQRYWRWNVSANSTNLGSRALAGVSLLAALETAGFRYDDGLDGPPGSGCHVSECYPYTTLVGYEPFGYDERPLYKRKPKSMPTAAFKPVRAAACDDLIRRVGELVKVDPALDLRSHPATAKLMEESSPLDSRAYKHREDLLDAALCAWTASLWHRHGREYCQVLGSEPGVERPAPTIIAPARPEQRANGVPSA